MANPPQTLKRFRDRLRAKRKYRKIQEEWGTNRRGKGPRTDRPFTRPPGSA